MTEKSKKLAVTIVSYLFLGILFYILITWCVFQWRNPKCNDMAFYRNFSSMITFKQLPEYQ